LLRQRKLVLVLDLDLTLVHTLNVASASASSSAMPVRDQALCNSDVHDVFGGAMVTKLRPGARDFLERTSRMFELCIYTMGNRAYAAAVRSILDPDRRLFVSVVSRDDSTSDKAKDLDVCMVDPRLTLIVDDTLEHR
jgi:RNA polymerase II subunit A-like phosphatase